MFLGRRLVETALARGHQVTVFNRGRHNDNVPAGVEVLTGDRNSDVSALRGRIWESVIDTCGYVPGSVRRVVDALDRDRIAHYTFVSSASVYADLAPAGSDENESLATITAEQLTEAEEIATGVRPTARTYGEMYGALKALCEQTAEQMMPGRVFNVRPGLIVGAYDYSAEDGLTFGTMLDVCRTVSASDARFTWLDENVVLQNGVQPWSDLPLWIPEADNGIFEVRNDKAIAHGLTFRPLSDTVRDTLDWDRARPQSEPMKAGLTREREQLLLSHASHSAH